MKSNSANTVFFCPACLISPVAEEDEICPRCVASRENYALAQRDAFWQNVIVLSAILIVGTIFFLIGLAFIKVN